jgi:hypothetical protein
VTWEPAFLKQLADTDNNLHLSTKDTTQKGRQTPHAARALPTMNRPSRTEDDLEHPTWNQNPPFLAPDLTTRQDLNGIANAREHRHGCSGAGNGGVFLDDEKRACDIWVCDTDRGSFGGCPLAMSGRLGRK